MNGNSLKATGRSSSQRSIKDYPEHLNPFYEDEHHKRLRFWKIGNDKASRSNSFSIDGLKGLWYEQIKQIYVFKKLCMFKTLTCIHICLLPKLHSEKVTLLKYINKTLLKVI